MYWLALYAIVLLCMIQLFLYNIVIKRRSTHDSNHLRFNPAGSLEARLIFGGQMLSFSGRGGFKEYIISDGAARSGKVCGKNQTNGWEGQLLISPAPASSSTERD